MNNYQKLINKSIKTLRLNHHLTQEAFAEKIGISIQGLSTIERNRYQPSAETIDKICAAFQISPVELLIDNSGTNDELINDINIKLKMCSRKKIKQISDIISIIIK